MERSASEYTQTGLPSPYPSNFGDAHSEGSSADHASAAQYSNQKDANYPASGTPTSEYGVYPQSARSGTFPEQSQSRQYQPATTPSSASMAQQNSPSLPQHDGQSHQSHPANSDSDVPIDPSIAAPSPTYPYGQHSPYGANPDMHQSYPHPSGGMYAQPRPEWSGYGQHGAPPMGPGGHPVYGQHPSAPGQQRPNHQRHRTMRIRTAREALLLTASSSYRSTRLFPFLVLSSTSDLADAMKRLNACTSADGTVAKRLMVL
ncbi:hypothetical protein Golomagni_06284 [Golovinomyces magnicellulatus]|nr:hypothetical protein Golomagni_06284 [Golovinomyces magnicellulatus]